MILFQPSIRFLKSRVLSKVSLERTFVHFRMNPHNRKVYFNRILERVGDSDEKNFTSVKEFIADTVKSVTEPEQPRLTIIFQWNPEVEFTSNDFTDNVLDACNYKILCAIQGKTGRKTGLKRVRP